MTSSEFGEKFGSVTSELSSDFGDRRTEQKPHRFATSGSGLSCDALFAADLMSVRLFLILRRLEASLSSSSSSNIVVVVDGL